MSSSLLAHLKTPLPSCFRKPPPGTRMGDTSNRTSVHGEGGISWSRENFFAFVEQSTGVARLRPYRVASSKNGIASRRHQPIVTPAKRSKSATVNSPSLRAPNSPALGCQVGDTLRYEHGSA